MAESLVHNCKVLLSALNKFTSVLRHVFQTIAVLRSRHYDLLTCIKMRAFCMRLTCVSYYVKRQEYLYSSLFNRILVTNYIGNKMYIMRSSNYSLISVNNKYTISHHDVNITLLYVDRLCEFFKRKN